jgi:hypothetical protein
MGRVWIHHYRIRDGISGFLDSWLRNKNSRSSQFNDTIIRGDFHRTAANDGQVPGFVYFASNNHASRNGQLAQIHTVSKMMLGQWLKVDFQIVRHTEHRILEPHDLLTADGFCLWYKVIHHPLYGYMPPDTCTFEACRGWNSVFRPNSLRARRSPAASLVFL